MLQNLRLRVGHRQQQRRNRVVGLGLPSVYSVLPQLSTRIPTVLATAGAAILPAECSGDFVCFVVQGEGQDGGRGADDQEQRHRQVRLALHELAVKLVLSSAS